MVAGGEHLYLCSADIHDEDLRWLGWFRVASGLGAEHLPIEHEPHEFGHAENVALRVSRYSIVNVLRDVNEYIKSATAPEFSAKDFRTWGGTLLAATELAEIGCCDDERLSKKHVAAAVRRVAERLGNTPTVCRNCYIHPSVIESYARGKTIEEFRPRRSRRIERRQPEYTVEELALLRLLARADADDERK